MTRNDRLDLEVSEVKLESAGQTQIRQIVKALPDDSVSMTWRSGLNQQLMALAAKERRRRRMLWIVRPALGISLASVLAVVWLFQPSANVHHPALNTGIEAAIIADHHNSSLLNEVSTAGLNPTEAVSDANTQDIDDGSWSESDVQSL